MYMWFTLLLIIFGNTLFVVAQEIQFGKTYLDDTTNPSSECYGDVCLSVKINHKYSPSLFQGLVEGLVEFDYGDIVEISCYSPEKETLWTDANQFTNAPSESVEIITDYYRNNRLKFMCTKNYRQILKQIRLKPKGTTVQTSKVSEQFPQKILDYDEFWLPTSDDHCDIEICYIHNQKVNIRCKRKYQNYPVMEKTYENVNKGFQCIKLINSATNDIVKEQINTTYVFLFDSHKMHKRTYYKEKFKDTSNNTLITTIVACVLSTIIIILIMVTLGILYKYYYLRRKPTQKTSGTALVNRVKNETNPSSDPPEDVVYATIIGTLAQKQSNECRGQDRNVIDICQNQDCDNVKIDYFQPLPEAKENSQSTQ